MGRKKKKCGLCSIKQKSRHWDEGNFFGLICKDKLVPIIVLKEHKSELTEKEMDELKQLVESYHPNLKLNLKLNHIDEHFCIYLKR